MSHVSNMDESCLKHECVMSYKDTPSLTSSYISHIDDPSLTYG